jgi:adenylate kinase family enzyme
VGRRLAASLGAPYVELDSIFHQSGWTDLATDEFRRRVTDLVAGDAWVIDGNYSAVRDLVWARADTVVWFDLPRPLVMRRVILRTLRRAVTRQELWNGNREPLTNFYRLDPEHNIIRWTWVMHPNYVTRYAAAMADPSNARLQFIRVRSPAEVAAFLATLS